MEQVVLQIYDGLYLILVDLVYEAHVYVYPCFFDRLIKAVDYAGLDSSLISGMNLDNCGDYCSEVRKLIDEIDSKYNLEKVRQDDELTNIGRLISWDYGYDITPIKEVDWDNLQSVCDFCYPVVRKIENMPFPKGYSELDIRQLFAQQIIAVNTRFPIGRPSLPGGQNTQLCSGGLLK